MSEKVFNQLFLPWSPSSVILRENQQQVKGKGEDDKRCHETAMLEEERERKRERERESLRERGESVS